MESMSHNGTFREQLIQRELPAYTHKPIRSLPVNITQILLLVVNVVLAFTYDHWYNKEDEDEDSERKFCNPISVLSYYHVLMWFVFLWMHWILKRLHRRSLAEGYFGFYRQTKEIRGAPFLIVSTGNAFLLVLNNLLRDLTYEHRYNEENKGLSKTEALHVLQIETCVELLTSLVFIFRYSYQVWQFNKVGDAPDYMQETNRFTEQFTEREVVEIGFREVDRAAEIIEKQYDIIVHLSEKLRHLVAQQHNHQSSGGARDNINRSSVFSDSIPIT